MGTDSKKKRGFIEIADSEDDDLSDTFPITQRTRNDEQVARQLQEDLDREAAEAYESEDESAEGVEQDQMDEDSDDLATVDPKGKGKGKLVAPRSRGGAAVKHVISDSEDDEADYSDSVDFEPPTKKRKTTVSKGKAKSKVKGKGKAKMPPPLSAGFDDDEDEDMPG